MKEGRTLTEKKIISCQSGGLLVGVSLLYWAIHILRHIGGWEGPSNMTKMTGWKEGGVPDYVVIYFPPIFMVIPKKNIMRRRRDISLGI